MKVADGQVGEEGSEGIGGVMDGGGNVGSYSGRNLAS